MTKARIPALAAICLLGSLIAACANGSGRYPELTRNSFDRMQGQFAASDSRPLVIEPDPLPVQDLTQLNSALDDARARHSRFMSQAERARGAVGAAAGTGPADKRWALAMVEIADLDSRAAASRGLLADLDRLYTAASLEFHQREEIAAARAETTSLVEAESLIIERLVAQIGVPPSTANE